MISIYEWLGFGLLLNSNRWRHSDRICIAMTISSELIMEFCCSACRLRREDVEDLVEISCSGLVMTHLTAEATTWLAFRGATRWPLTPSTLWGHGMAFSKRKAAARPIADVQIRRQRSEIRHLRSRCGRPRPPAAAPFNTARLLSTAGRPLSQCNAKLNIFSAIFTID